VPFRFSTQLASLQRLRLVWMSTLSLRLYDSLSFSAGTAALRRQHHIASATEILSFNSCGAAQQQQQVFQRSSATSSSAPAPCSSLTSSSAPAPRGSASSSSASALCSSSSPVSSVSNSVYEAKPAAASAVWGLHLISSTCEHLRLSANDSGSNSIQQRTCASTLAQGSSYSRSK